MRKFGWVRGPAVQIIVQLRAFRVGDQIVQRAKHENKHLNNKVCEVREIRDVEGTYDSRRGGRCVYIANIQNVRPRTEDIRFGGFLVIAEDIIAWRRPLTTKQEVK